MSPLSPYLFFAGRCEEAIAFYEQALGAKLQMKMKFNESPEPIPPGRLQSGFESKIMHASLIVNGAVLMLSDGCDDRTNFDGFQLALQYATEEAARKAFDGLSAGGTVELPLTKTFWSPCYGMVTDKFKVGWMVMVPGPQPPSA